MLYPPEFSRGKSYVKFLTFFNNFLNYISRSPTLTVDLKITKPLFLIEFFTSLLTFLIKSSLDLPCLSSGVPTVIIKVLPAQSLGNFYKI